MNTSGAGQPDGLVGGVTGLRDLGALPEPQRRTREEEDLLAAIAAALQARMPAPTMASIQGVTDPAERWRQSGGALTGTTEHIDAAPAGAPPPGGEIGADSRLVARIDAPGLGSVCIVVDRSESGLKVWLGMDDGAAAQNALAGRAELVRALETAGLTVASVSVTRMTKGGITFAQVRDAHEAELFGNSDGSERAEGKPDARSRRRLNLVG